jgi:hypothetical protein
MSAFNTAAKWSPKCIVEVIMARRDMLAEYFSVHVSPDCMVESLPLLLRDYAPNLDKLPKFLMRLGPQVRHPMAHSLPLGS